MDQRWPHGHLLFHRRPGDQAGGYSRRAGLAPQGSLTRGRGNRRHALPGRFLPYFQRRWSRRFGLGRAHGHRYRLHAGHSDHARAAHPSFVEDLLHRPGHRRRSWRNPGHCHLLHGRYLLAQPGGGGNLSPAPVQPQPGPGLHPSALYHGGRWPVARFPAIRRPPDHSRCAAGHDHPHPQPGQHARFTGPGRDPAPKL